MKQIPVFIILAAAFLVTECAQKRKIAFAIGKTGCDYSPDGGRTWIPGLDVKDYYTAGSIPGALSGFAAGAKGRIARVKVERVEDVE